MFNEIKAIISRFASKRSNLIISAVILSGLSVIFTYSIENIILYCILTYFTLKPLIEESKWSIGTVVVAIIWTPITIYSLFKGLCVIGIFGIPGLVAYWRYLKNLFDLRSNQNTTQTQDEPTQATNTGSKNTPTRTNTDSTDNSTGSTDNPTSTGSIGNSTDTSSTSSSTSTGPSIIRVHARIPVLRIPLPWITYTLNMTKEYIITRSSWFGKTDPEPIKGIKNWYISGGAIRLLTGVSSFWFQSTKPHSDDYTKWRCLPRIFAEILSKTLEKRLG